MNRLYSGQLVKIVLGLVMACAIPATGFAARTADPSELLFTETVEPLFLAGEYSDGVSSSGSEQSGSERLRVAFADDVTQAIVNQIKRGAAECNRLDKVYRLDCLRQTYNRAAGATGNRRDYSAANGELRKLSRALNGIVRQNLDRKAPKVKSGSKSFRAVSQEALREANRQANQAIGEATTRLLRSAGNAQKRKVHYTRIADAVNSTKKILRS